jgi:hypothetical protein
VCVNATRGVHLELFAARNIHLNQCVLSLPFLLSTFRLHLAFVHKNSDFKFGVEKVSNRSSSLSQSVDGSQKLTLVVVVVVTVLGQDHEKERLDYSTRR